MITTQKAHIAHKAIEHLKAWFVTERTMMNPSLLYAQAIKGISSGRGIGIIDSIVLIHVATCTEYLIAEGIIEGYTADGIRSWFDKFSTWLTTHPYGIKEQNNDNNLGHALLMWPAPLMSIYGTTRVKMVLWTKR